jgi:hypothetical protein
VLYQVGSSLAAVPGKLNIAHSIILAISSQLPPSAVPRPELHRAARRSDHRSPAPLRPGEPRYRSGRIFLSPLPSTRICQASSENHSSAATSCASPRATPPMRPLSMKCAPPPGASTARSASATSPASKHCARSGDKTIRPNHPRWADLQVGRPLGPPAGRVVRRNLYPCASGHTSQSHALQPLKPQNLRLWHPTENPPKPTRTSPPRSPASCSPVTFASRAQSREGPAASLHPPART